ncbi:hypothetical protein ACO34A_15645 [Rhizobium sp. ACO-34A]|nr:restriction endonuclease subunit S [Rhizobium sp. ACO-34A]ATN35236.1 hypothetical protein ACO34A_15645 [Rhizobium sp. ACO-34A]
MVELPEGWGRLKLGEAGEWFGGGTPSKNNPGYWESGTIPWVSPKDMKHELIAEATDYITEEAVRSSSTRIVPQNSVIMVTRSGILQHTLPVGLATREVAINQDLKAIHPNDAVDPKYLLYHLISDSSDILAKSAKTGTTVESLTLSKLKNYELRIAPLLEQKRIVAKIETLKSRTAKVRENLEAISPLIDTLRLRLTEAALSGDLTSDWRKINNNSKWISEAIETLRSRRLQAKKNVDPSIIVEISANIRPELPATWLRCCIADVADLRVGYAFKSHWFSDEGVPLLRGANVAPGRIDWNDQRRLPLEIAAEYREHALTEGDIVLAMDRPLISTGLKIAVVEAEDSGALLVQRVANPRPTEMIRARYLHLILSGPAFRRHIGERATGSDLPHISSADIQIMPLDLPSTDEQDEILRRIDLVMGWVKRVSSDHSIALTLLPKIELSILAKAFRGELATHDPADEPAPWLITRVKEAQAKAPKVATPKRPKEHLMIKNPKERLLLDSENWPAEGLPFDQVAKRNPLPYDEMRDAVFALLAGTAPSFEQVFDRSLKRVLLRRIKP